MCTEPAVGSTRRVRQRTSVDLPLPERPITTNTSPRPTSNETSRAATVQPVFAISSARGRSTSPLEIARAALSPKTFQRSRQETCGSEEADDLTPFIDVDAERCRRLAVARHGLHVAAERHDPAGAGVRPKVAHADGEPDRRVRELRVVRQ